MFKAIIVADSLNPFGDRITTMQVTFNRWILAEFNTHRMFSRNSASSRAIPTKKMLKMVMENPFIPIAWQKEHTGMQGFEYYDTHERFNLHQLKIIMLQRLSKIFNTEGEEEVDSVEILAMFDKVIADFPLGNYTLNEMWLMIRDKIVNATLLLYCLGVSKQLCNRLLEPFMWHTVIVTATEWENFFALRSPQYTVENLSIGTEIYRSKKDLLKSLDGFPNIQHAVNGRTDLEWMKGNKGQAEIHMMALAEAMWDAYNESVPVQLKAGEWHIPYEKEIRKLYPVTIDELTHDSLSEIPSIVKISTVMCARVSYTVVGTELSEWTVEKYVNKCDGLATAKPIHASPFEHCARAMNDREHDTFGRTGTKYDKLGIPDLEFGWSGNFRGFIQYRKILPNENITAK